MDGKRKANDALDSAYVDGGPKSSTSANKVLSVIQEGISEFEEASTVGSSNSNTMIEDNDARVKELALRNIRSLFRTNSAPGTRLKSSQAILDVIASVVMSKDIKDERLEGSVARVFGMSEKQRKRGRTLNHSRSNCLSPAITLRRKPQSSGPKAKLDLDFVINWFHEDCPLVELDKGRRNTYKGRRIRCGNEIRFIYCQRRIRNGLKKYLVQSFLVSDVYKDWNKRTGRTISEKTIASCICFCIKEAKINECVCTICVQFRYLLKAWDMQRKVWHATPCSCRGCVSSKFKDYMGASQSSSAFKSAILCGQRPYPHLIFAPFAAGNSAILPAGML